MSSGHKLASELLRIKAVQINPTTYFTWSSGIKSPIYCDNRIAMSFPEVRELITDAFVEKVNGMKIKPDIIAGCATGGIPHAAWLADRLRLPMVYVRPKPKGHGKGNQIEGNSVQRKKVLVIEDLISTGGSSLDVVAALRDSGAEILDVMSIFTYGLKIAHTNFERAEIQYQSLTNYDELIHLLVADEKINTEEKVELLQWRTAIESKF